MLYTLHLIKEKGDDSKWSIISWGPICYLACSKEIAEFIINAMNDDKSPYKPV